MNLEKNYEGLKYKNWSRKYFQGIVDKSHMITDEIGHLKSILVNISFKCCSCNAGLLNFQTNSHLE